MVDVNDPRRPRLNAEPIVEAAIRLIDEIGLEEFSMPKLAATLGVRTSSLYRYFADREALLTAIARAVITVDEAPSLPSPDAHWTDFLVDQSASLRRRVLRHPRCAPLIIQFASNDGIFDQYELMCQYLAASGVPAAFHVRVVDALTVMTIGSAVLDESAADYAPSGPGTTPDPVCYPALTQALTAIGDASADDLFDGFLRTYLRAILAEIAESAGPHAGEPG